MANILNYKLDDKFLLEPEEKKAWRNVASNIAENRTDIFSLLTDRYELVRFQFFCVFIIFGVVSFGMSAVNQMTGYHTLMMATLLFGFANLINIGLCFISWRAELASRVIFAIEFLTLFSFFVIMGEPEGFSAIWAAMLPSCGVLLYRVKWGSILSAVQLAIIVFLFWTPVGQSLLQYQYTDSFLLRFPMLYTAFFAVGLVFEIILDITQNELTKARDQYRFLYNHDALTGLYNRYGFNTQMNRLMEERTSSGYAFAILDIDHFKNVNDTYGHVNGDFVLKAIAGYIEKMVGEDGIVCRWGGEEFSVFIYDPGKAKEICAKLIAGRQDDVIKITDDELIVTVSIGLVISQKGSKVETNDILSAADINLYNAKNNGRNRMTVTVI